MNMNGPTPTDLGGFQNIVTGVVQEGDLCVTGCNPDQDFSWAVAAIGKNVEDLDGDLRIYRRIPVARQGGLDLPVGHNMFLSHGREIAKTNDEGKPPLAMLPSAGIRAVAQVQAFGHKKYHDFHNFRKGIEHSRALSCVIRHVMAHMDGETKDPESGELHLAHAACRLLFLIQNMSDGKDIDDRFKNG